MVRGKKRKEKKKILDPGPDSRLASIMNQENLNFKSNLSSFTLPISDGEHCLASYIVTFPAPRIIIGSGTITEKLSIGSSSSSLSS